MRSDNVATLLPLAAAGELVGDKLPSAPARVAPLGLSGRIASGALCGAALSRSAREDTFTGAAFGALGAVVGAYVFYEVRRVLTQEEGMPDLPVALAEDALAFGLGTAVLEQG